MTEPRIVAEDRERIALYKPAALPVFPPHRDPAQPSLLSWWLQNGGRSADWPEGYAGGIAHRLDNRTDGLVIVARDPAALQRLRASFAAGQLRKFYLFRSAAEVSFDLQLCTLPIAHHQKKKDRMVVKNGPRSWHRGNWYPAWTQFTRLAPSLWQAEIRTGVMHQIRVHAAAVGLPLDDDSLYGGAEGVYLLRHFKIIGPDWEFFMDMNP
jgi:23S rRNA-/tRNA-specific pseudouridylate synthase